MLFEFQKYINPTWYFNLKPENLSIPYFIDYQKLSADEQKLLNIDEGYITREGKHGDAAWQSWQKGVILRESKCSLYKNNSVPEKKRTIELFKGLGITVNQDVFVKNIPDNYRFVRRYFNPAFGLYILLIRLFSLLNPIKEISGFFGSLKVKRIDPYKNNAYTLYKQDYETFSSSLISKNPSVSVIIPTLNRYTYLNDVLSDLEKQDYKNFEVIVCDQSENFDATFYQGWKLDLKLIRQQEKALWLARNQSIKEAKGEYIALSEDDVRIKPDWLSQHLKCIDFFDSDISAGVFFPEGQVIPKQKTYFKWAEQFATGNALIKKSVFHKTGLFDRQFEKQRSGDGEFGLRAFLSGFVSISNPLAYCEDVKAPIGGLRQMGSWDSFRPTKLFAPRPVPSVLYLTRKYFGNKAAFLVLLLSVPGSVVPYKYKTNKALKLIAYLSLMLTWPVILIQVVISWNRASKKIREGSKIELINKHIKISC